jgi:hypothetical protein
MTDYGVLKPGHGAEINTIFIVDVLMDCLIVLLPELALQMAQTQSQSWQIEYTVTY